MTNQTKNNNLNYLINATFIKVLSFENETDRTSFSKYYLTNVQINDFNVLIDEKGFFDMPIKNGKEKWEQIIEMGRTILHDRKFIGLWVLFKTLQINCNRSKQTNWIRKSLFNTTN